MTLADMNSSTIERLGTLLEDDIRRRGLVQGDRYLGGAEAAELLGCSPATANRALKWLADRKLLQRRRNHGTFVTAASIATRVQTVYVLQRDDEPNASALPIETLLRAIRTEMKEVNVQFTFLPGNNSLTYVRELLGPTQGSGQLAGVIPISCPHEVYAYLAEQRIPTVVLGSLYADCSTLVSVNIDSFGSGRLMAEHLVRQGHRRMAVFSSSEGRPGDHAFLDGISEALTEARLPHNSLLLRITPNATARQAAIEEMLRSADPPTGFITRNAESASAVQYALEASGHRAKVVYELLVRDRAGELPLAHVRPRISFEQIMETIARTLSQVCQGKRPNESRIIVPMEFNDLFQKPAQTERSMEEGNVSED